MKPGAKFETPMVVPLGISISLVNKQIGQVSSKSGKFVAKTYMSTFLVISFSLEIETLQNH